MQTFFSYLVGVKVIEKVSISFYVIEKVSISFSRSKLILDLVIVSWKLVKIIFSESESYC